MASIIMAMGKVGTILRFSLWVFIVFFALAVFLLPHIDLKGVRERIAAEASLKLNGKVLITRASLALLPWPHITLKEVQIESPQWGELASEEIGIYPRLAPLFKKQIVLKSLRLKRPVVDVTLVEEAMGKGKEAVSSLDQSMVQAIPALDIKEGMANIRRPGQKEPLLKIEGVRGSITPREGRQVELGLQFTSSGVERLEVRAKGDPALGRGWLELRAKGISLDKLIPLMGWKGLTVLSSRMDLRVSGEALGWDRFRFRLEGGEFQIILAAEGGSEEIAGSSWTGELKREDNVWRGKIEPLQLRSPSLKVSAWTWGKRGESFSFLIKGSGANVEEIREVALKVMGKDETVQEIFQILQEGQVSPIICAGQGKDFKDAFDVERNVKIRGTLSGGKILVPAGPLPLQEVSGEVMISQTVMRGWNVAARLGRSKATRAELVIGLTAEKDVFHLEADVEADAEDVVHYMPMVLEDTGLKTEIERFREANGRVLGKLVLGESLHDVRPTVEVEDFGISFRHEMFPWPISLTGEGLSLRDMVLSWKGVRGKLGRSALSQGGGSISFVRERPSLEIASMKGTVNVQEMGGWLKEQLGGLEGLDFVEGSLELSDLKLTARLDPFQLQRISFAAKLGDLVIRSPSVPFALSLTRGGLSLRQKVLSWRGVRGKLGRSTLSQGGGSISFVRERPSLEIASMKGTVNVQEMGGWLKEQLGGLEGLDFVEGSLELSDLKLTARLDPFQLQRISFAAKLGDLVIRSPSVPFVVRGGLVRSNDYLVLKTLEGGTKPYGELIWTADAMSWKSYRWQDVEGIATFGDQRPEIRVTTADLCGINWQGTIALGEETTMLDLRVGAKEAKLAPTISCLSSLWGKDALADGTFLLQGDIRAEGKTDPLRENSYGNLLFHSTEGRIYRWTLISKLLSLLNVMEFLKGKLPDLTQKGFQYDAFTVTAELKNGSIRLKEAVIDAAAMKIVGEGEIDLLKGEANLVVLMAPLKTVDTVIEHIPILGRIFTGKSGTFISVPFSVKGPLDDPTITPLSVSAVGTGVWGLLRRTLRAPLEILQPALPEQ